MRATILCSGLAVQQANFRNVEAERTFKNLKKYQQKTNKDGVTKLNKMKIIEETESKYQYKITRCLFFDFFQSVGVPELTKIFCSIDNAIFYTYLPNEVIFHRQGMNKTIADGEQECMFVLEKSN